MAWIELHQSLPGHRKTRQAAKALNITRTQFIGHIVQFWLWALDNAPDGTIDDIDAATIAEVSEWEGDPGQFMTVLVAAGFIDIDDADKQTIHDWWDYAGKLFETRRRDRNRKRLAKESASGGCAAIPVEGRRNSSGNNNIPAESDQFLRHRTQPTVPNRTVPEGDARAPDPSPTPNDSSAIHRDLKNGQYPHVQRLAEWLNDEYGKLLYPLTAGAGSFRRMEEQLVRLETAVKAVTPEHDFLDVLKAKTIRGRYQAELSDGSRQYAHIPISDAVSFAVEDYESKAAKVTRSQNSPAPTPGVKGGKYAGIKYE